MGHSCHVRLVSYIIVLVIASVSLVRAAPDKKTEDTIGYLLDYVATSKATFIRNGTAHTASEAVAHIRAKYEHFKSQINTPQDFIRLSASKSLLTGQPYLVRTSEGKEIRLEEWLTDELKRHRSE